LHWAYCFLTLAFATTTKNKNPSYNPKMKLPKL
jgi:hypothetical protein